MTIRLEIENKTNKTDESMNISQLSNVLFPLRNRLERRRVMPFLFHAAVEYMSITKLILIFICFPAGHGTTVTTHRLWFRRF